MREPIKLWIENAIPMGSFGTALVSNDLVETVRRADYINKLNLQTIITWFYNYAPSECWGSRENVAEWRGIIR